MARLETIGAFGLTEPFIGSDASHIQTRATRVGDRYVLNGAKRWIGNATFADVTVVWARDEDTGQVAGFLVEKGTPGFDGDHDGGQAGQACADQRRHHAPPTADPGREPARQGQLIPRHGEGARERATAWPGKPLDTRWPPTRSRWLTRRSASSSAGRSPASS